MFILYSYPVRRTGTLASAHPARGGSVVPDAGRACGNRAAPASQQGVECAHSCHRVVAGLQLRGMDVELTLQDSRFALRSSLDGGIQEAYCT